ncbi:MAG: hypothetical protein AAF846_16430 [Chloroflexota bacterium]
MRFNKNTEKYNTAELTAQAYRAQVSGNRHQENRGKQNHRRR